MAQNHADPADPDPQNCRKVTEGGSPEVLPAGGSQLVVVPGVVVDTGLRQHGVVLDLGFPA
jgi:hypothetical protein